MDGRESVCEWCEEEKRTGGRKEVEVEVEAERQATRTPAKGLKREAPPRQP